MEENKLRARWSKSENDILITYPLGRQTKCDSNYLFSNTFTDEFVKEIESRGYDIKTLKFEITVDEKGKRYQEKFPTLAGVEPI
jgi:hypothetical protein